jgi:hypothetical protein
MNNDFSQIEQDPSRISSALTMMWANTFLLQCLVYLLPNSFNLPLAIPTANNKVISKGANLSGI